jgi:O-antigen/teichoic acid export membrane protein
MSAARGLDLRSQVSVGRGAIVTIVGTFILLIFQLITRISIARAFTISTWGEFSLGLAFASLLASTAPLGLNLAVARVLAHETDPAIRRSTVRSAIIVTAIASASASAAVYFLALPLSSLYHSTDFIWIFRLFSVTVGFTILNTVLASIFQGFEDTAPNSWFNLILTPGLLVAFVLAAIVFQLGFFWVVVGYVLANALTFATFCWYTFSRLPKLLPRNVGPLPKAPPELWSLSFSLWGVGALAYVTTFADTLILGVFRTTQQVGIYSSAVTLARLVLVGAGALTYIVLPVTARLGRQKDFATIRVSYIVATRWTIAITLPMLLLFGFLPQLSMGAVFGDRYDPGAGSLEILVIASFLSVVVGPVNACLGGLGRSRDLLIATMVSAVSNVVLSFTLIPAFGSIGAATAWGIARLLFPLTCLVPLYRDFRISPIGGTLLRPLALALGIGIPMFAGLSLITLPFWSVIPLFLFGSFLFIACLFITRSLDHWDFILVSALERVLGRPLPKLRHFLNRFVRTPAPPP